MTRAKQKESGHSGQPSVVASRSRKYMNEFLKTKCSIILLENELFRTQKSYPRVLVHSMRAESTLVNLRWTAKVFHSSLLEMV